MLKFFNVISKSFGFSCFTDVESVLELFINKNVINELTEIPKSKTNIFKNEKELICRD